MFPSLITLSFSPTPEVSSPKFVLKISYLELSHLYVT